MNSSRTLWWFLSVCVDGLAGLTQKPERQHVGAVKPNCSVAGAVQNPPVEARDNGEQNISMGREEGAGGDLSPTDRDCGAEGEGLNDGGRSHEQQPEK